jgi:methylglyoxal/glyoxal reductase
MQFEVDGSGICWIEGSKYSSVGLGTSSLKDVSCFNVINRAAQVGYRIIDTATFYRNFVPIGQALKALGRNNFYLISKVWPDAQTPEKLQKDVKSALVQLQTDYLDAYLLHWPNSKISIKDTLQAMEELRATGLIRHIGLSNITVHHLKRILEFKISLSWVQVEMHPLFYDAELLKVCQEQLLTVQAWAPSSWSRRYWRA